MNITLLIPTKNRPDFLASLLGYYADAEFSGTIFIGDSSEGDDYQRNLAAIEAFGRRMKVRHVPCPSMTPGVCLEKLSGLVDTPYCAYLGDDDFLTVSGLGRCVDYLNSYPEYTAANGDSFIVYLESGRDQRINIKKLTRYKSIELNDSVAGERLGKYFNFRGSSILFCVFRTPIFAMTYRGAVDMQVLKKGNTIKDELLPACLAALSGKIKHIPGLYMLRRVHQGYYNKAPSLYDQVTRSDWSDSYQFFHDRLVEEMLQRDGVSVERAQDVIKEGFWPLLANGMLSSWRGFTLNRQMSESRWRSFLRSIPGLRSWWIQMRLLGFFQEKQDVSLAYLKGRFSRYRRDFEPIHKIITQNVKESRLKTAVAL